jgi:general secretion pathway protein M
MKAWWLGLSDRDRRVLAVGAALAAVLLLYALAWLPLERSREAMRVQAAALDASYRWMQAAAPEVQRLRAGGAGQQVADGRSLLARADAGARESALGTALLRVEPVAEGQVRMVFQQVGFDALMAWLEQFSRSQSLRVTEFNVQTTGASGQVDARIGLEERR